MYGYLVWDETLPHLKDCQVQAKDKDGNPVGFTEETNFLGIRIMMSVHITCFVLELIRKP